MTLRQWWEETHTPQFELIRHFGGQFFESELVARPGQLKLLFGGVLSVLASLSILFLQSYYHKYLQLNRLDDAEPFRQAVHSDVLFLVCLNMAAIGLITALFWNALFPDRRDYFALAGLPLRPAEIFRAKFTALLGFVTACVVFLAAPPALGLPWVMLPQRGSPQFYAMGQMGWHVPGMFLASAGAGLFTFFILVAAQGVVLNVLPPRQAARASQGLQALLVITILAGMPSILTVSGTDVRTLPGWWPPLWFLRIDLALTENATATSAWVALATSATAAIAAYWWSYRRHRIRVIESPGASSVAALRLPELPLTPRTVGVFEFVARTLARSPQHRLILTGFTGLSLAVAGNGLVGAVLQGADARIPTQALAVAANLAMSLFTLTGLLYLFRLPVEPRANWIFRIYEPGHGPALLRGLEAFVLVAGVAPVAAIHWFVDIALFGWARGTVLALLAILPALLLTQGLLLANNRLPFTSLYLPARRMITETLIKYGVGLVLYVSLLSAVLAWSAVSAARWIPLMALLTVALAWLRRIRLDIQRITRLEFEELPDVIVQTIGIERD